MSGFEVHATSLSASQCPRTHGNFMQKCALTAISLFMQQFFSAVTSTTSPSTYA